MRPPRIATNRAVLLQEWRAAQHRVAAGGVVELTAAEEAGRVLAEWDNASVAHTLCNVARAKSLLAKVVIEEGGAVSPSGRNES